MTLENVKNLFTNLRIGMYDAVSYKICTSVRGEYDTYLKIKDINKNIQIFINLYDYRDLGIENPYCVTVAFSDEPGLAPIKFNVTREEYESFYSYILEEATKRDVIMEAIAIDAFEI